MTITPPSNQRATAAAAALLAYVIAKLGHQGTLLQSPEEWLVDLLTDLRHHAAELQIDFGAAVRISEYHFEEEAST